MDIQLDGCNLMDYTEDELKALLSQEADEELQLLNVQSQLEKELQYEELL